MSMRTTNIVKYDNSLNEVSLRTLSEAELNVFWTICSLLKEKGEQEQIFHYDYLKELMHFQRKDINFADTLETMWSKLKNISFDSYSEGIHTSFMLFNMYINDTRNETLTIRTNESFSFILNNLGMDSRRFTYFELTNMLNISSSYTKELYRQLLSHRNANKKTGFWSVGYEDFRRIMAVPNSYRTDTIDTRIINRSIRELTKQDKQGHQILRSLICTKIKKGRRLSSYRFDFEIGEEFDYEMPEIANTRKEEKSRPTHKIPLQKWVMPEPQPEDYQVATESRKTNTMSDEEYQRYLQSLLDKSEHLR